MASKNPKTASLDISVLETSCNVPLFNACILLYSLDSASASTIETGIGASCVTPRIGFTDQQGKLSFSDLVPGRYEVEYGHLPQLASKQITVVGGKREKLTFSPNFAVQIETQLLDRHGNSKRGNLQVGDVLLLQAAYNFSDKVKVIASDKKVLYEAQKSFPFSYTAHTTGTDTIEFQFSIPASQSAIAASSAGTIGQVSGNPPETKLPGERLYAQFNVLKEVTIMSDSTKCGAQDPIRVKLGRTDSDPTSDTTLWGAIRASTEALSFERYASFIQKVITSGKQEGENASDPMSKMQSALKLRSVPFTNGEAYRVLKVATEAFVMVNCGVSPYDLASNNANGTSSAELNKSIREYMELRDISPPEDSATTFVNDYLADDPVTGDKNPMLPYLAIIRRKIPELSIGGTSGFGDELGYQLVQKKLAYPCMLELIWSYWHEEGMLVQTMNAITRRFQNVRSPHGNDPLANLEIDPLRPLNNIIWGYTQDEQNRLTVVRRNYEYDHHYGLRLEGRAVQNFRPADTRSKFLEAFHHLLRMCSQFYKQDDDTTVKADAFPVLNALKEVHLILSQGAHNQFGDLPSVARVEMLMQQWMLARPEFRDFLPTRMMVAYPEPWMDRVDAMKKLQGWSDTSVMHFRSLGKFGEQVLLSVRFGAWSDIYEPQQAFNWARFWRPQVQGYIHAYRAATGVDLTGTAVDTIVDATMPSVLLQRRLAQQARSA